MPTTGPVAKKLWQASQILNCSPFSPELLALNAAQLDFILEMWCGEDPRRGRLLRPGAEPEGIDKTQAKAAWTKRLIGAGLDRFLGRQRPSAAVLAKLRAAGVAPTGTRQRRK